MSKTVTTNYSIGDFLIRVKNTVMAGNKSLTAPSNKQIEALTKAFEKLGYFETVKKEKGFLTIALTFKNKKPYMMDLKLVSKPGLRVYKGVDELEVKKGPSTYLISTPKGILSTREAIKQRIGGEVICEIL